MGWLLVRLTATFVIYVLSLALIGIICEKRLSLNMWCEKHCWNEKRNEKLYYSLKISKLLTQTYN